VSVKVNNKAYDALIRDGITAQGDLLIVNIALLPTVHDGWEVVHSPNNRHVVAHSETGHHHILGAYTPPASLLAHMAAPVLLRDPKAADREMVSVVKVPDDSLGEIVHMRDFDTHETHILPPGNWVLLRQGRPTPEGWKKVQD
jgi:hypothetical protein